MNYFTLDIWCGLNGIFSCLFSVRLLYIAALNDSAIKKRLLVFCLVPKIQQRIFTDLYIWSLISGNLYNIADFLNKNDLRWLPQREQTIFYMKCYSFKKKRITFDGYKSLVCKRWHALVQSRFHILKVISSKELCYKCIHS